MKDGVEFCAHAVQCANVNLAREFSSAFTPI